MWFLNPQDCCKLRWSQELYFLKCMHLMTLLFKHFIVKQFHKTMKIIFFSRTTAKRSFLKRHALLSYNCPYLFRPNSFFNLLICWLINILMISNFCNLSQDFDIIRPQSIVFDCLLQLWRPHGRTASLEVKASRGVNVAAHGEPLSTSITPLSWFCEVRRSDRNMCTILYRIICTR